MIIGWIVHYSHNQVVYISLDSSGVGMGLPCQYGRDPGRAQAPRSAGPGPKRRLNGPNPSRGSLAGGGPSGCVLGLVRGPRGQSQHAKAGLGPPQTLQACL